MPLIDELANGEVKDLEIEKNRDGEEKVVILQVELFDPDNVESVELYRSSGEDVRPPDSTKVAVINIGEAWKLAVACNDNVEPDDSLEKGEKKVYSSAKESGKQVVKAFIEYKKDGKLRMNTQDENDFAVRFNEMQSAFDELKDDLNAQISNIFNNHTHDVPQAPSGTTTSTPPTPTGTDSAADMSNAKVEDIIFPEYTV
jgi:hypothetical protein